MPALFHELRGMVHEFDSPVGVGRRAGAGISLNHLRRHEMPASNPAHAARVANAQRRGFSPG